MIDLRKNKTEEKIIIAKGYGAIFALIVVLLSILSLIILLSSCATDKYGCGHGAPKMKWNKMVKYINRQ